MNEQILNVEDNLLTIFTDESDIAGLHRIMEINNTKITHGMTKFQIENFILNKKEFTNELFQYKQTKAELYSRSQIFIDAYFQLREAQSKIKLAEGKIKLIESESMDKVIWGQTEAHKLIRESKIELQQLEIEKQKYKIIIIQRQAKDTLKEAVIFLDVYTKYQYLENLNEDELEKLEESGWKIKSRYYPELFDRYQLTPEGILQLPHEKHKSNGRGEIYG